jgi:hypothetical protein
MLWRRRNQFWLLLGAGVYLLFRAVQQQSHFQVEKDNSDYALKVVFSWS